MKKQSVEQLNAAIAENEKAIDTALRIAKDMTEHARAQVRELRKKRKALLEQREMIETGGVKVADLLA